MAWDIYGNPLQRGHCEVHPHVHEEYPCSVCMSERGQTQQPHDALQQLQHEFAQQGDYIKQLEAERDALAAQVEPLREELSGLASVVYKTSKALIDATETLENELLPALEDKDPLIGLIEEFKSVIAATPQQCLRDVQAEAGRAGFIAGCHCGANYNIHDWDNQADEYAESVRQGGAE